MGFIRISSADPPSLPSVQEVQGVQHLPILRLNDSVFNAVTTGLYPQLFLAGQAVRAGRVVQGYPKGEENCALVYAQDHRDAHSQQLPFLRKDLLVQDAPI